MRFKNIMYVSSSENLTKGEFLYREQKQHLDITNSRIRSPLDVIFHYNTIFSI